MKRALAMALGAMMVAGSAAPASAASQVDFSGYFRVYGISATNLGAAAGDAAFTDGYFGNRLVFDLTFRPTDELEVVWQMRAPHMRRWGAGADNRSGMETGTWHAYGVVKQDWGNVYIGRFSQKMDETGLSTLGWTPSTNPVYTYASAFDKGSAGFDAVRYANRWDNGFGLLAQYGKRSNNSGNNTGSNFPGAAGQGQPGNFHSDQDYDEYQVEASYLWDGGGAALAVRYDRDASQGWDGSAWDAFNAFYVNPSIAHSWGDFSIHFEGMAGWGKADWNGHGFPKGTRGRDYKAEGYAAYLDFDYNYGPGNVNLAGWYASGSDLEDDKKKSLVAVNQGNFYPLLVAYHATGAPAGGARRTSDGVFASAGSGDAISMANNAYANFVADGHITYMWNPNVMNQGTALGVFADFNAAVFAQGRERTVTFNSDALSTFADQANHWALALSGNHAFTDDISMHYALAYLALSEPNYKVASKGNYNAANECLGPWLHHSGQRPGLRSGLGLQLQTAG